jgi:hypothetical protein
MHKQAPEAMEMTGRGSPGKPQSGFPPLPPPLEIASRFPHSHSREYDYLFRNLQKGAPARRFTLQAHPCIGKCYGAYQVIDVC